MLRSTCTRLYSPVSKQSRHTGFWLGGGKGRRYEKRSIRSFANGGWGIGTYTTKKDRRWPTPMFTEEKPAFKPRNMPMSNTTKTLSAEWRPYALADGGVLFVHPTRDQVMQWSHQVLVREREATGMASRDHDVSAKMQALMADNTLEHISLAAWRKEQLTKLIRKHSGVNLPRGEAGWF
jgi:hypothetical protein